MKPPRSKFPKFGDWLLRLFARYDVNPHLRGDFDEEFSFICETKGYVRAWFWYWTHLLRSIPVFIKDILYWRIIMLKNQFITAIRNFKRHKGFTSINFIGLTVGLTCFLLIMLYIKFEFSFDRYHENADSIYRIIVDIHEFYQGKDQVSYTPSLLAESLKEELPEVVNATKIFAPKVNIRHNEQIYSETIFFADPEILEMFTFPMILGDTKTAMQSPNSLLLTRKSAAKYFRNQNPIGQSLSVENREYHITGVLENIPENSHVYFDFLSPFSTYVDIHGRDEVLRWQNWAYYTYVQLRQDADPAQVEPKLTTLLKRHRENPTRPRTLRLQPLKSIHFYGGTHFDMEPNTDIRNIYLYSAIALFILLIACFNYMNLSTARASLRAKEIGMRKVIGATQRSLIWGFLTESFLCTLVSLFLCIGFVKLLLPSFGALMNSDLKFSQITQGGTPLYLLGILLFVGLTSGLYPAVVLSSFRPASILKGNYKLTGRGSLFRNSLVSLQFVISITLIFCSLVVYKQIRFVRNRDLGFVTDYTMSVYCARDADAIRQELRSISGIHDVTASSQTPINVESGGHCVWEGKSEEDNLLVYMLSVDTNFFDFYDIELLSGRPFSKERATDREAYILNEAAVKALGWENPLGKRFGFSRKNLGTVIGVVKDFHIAPLNVKIEPLAIFLNSEKEGIILSLKLAPYDIPGTIASVESTWKKFHPDSVFRYSFLNETLNRIYRKERRLGTMFLCFTILAILIAGLGLFGIASFKTEQMTKEIGIRKVLGASVSGISVLLMRNFLKLVIISHIIALPGGWFIMQKWLQNFAYRTGIGPLVFMTAAFLAIGIALVTISYKSIKSAFANPVDALRYE
jgi:putative ABC transport system permease protein